MSHIVCCICTQPIPLDQYRIARCWTDPNGQTCAAHARCLIRIGEQDLGLRADEGAAGAAPTRSPGPAMIPYQLTDDALETLHGPDRCPGEPCEHCGGSGKQIEEHAALGRERSSAAGWCYGEPCPTCGLFNNGGAPVTVPSCIRSTIRCPAVRSSSSSVPTARPPASSTTDATRSRTSLRNSTVPSARTATGKPGSAAHGSWTCGGGMVPREVRPCQRQLPGAVRGPADVPVSSASPTRVATSPPTSNGPTAPTATVTAARSTTRTRSS